MAQYVAYWSGEPIDEHEEILDPLDTERHRDGHDTFVVFADADAAQTASDEGLVICRQADETDVAALSYSDLGPAVANPADD